MGKKNHGMLVTAALAGLILANGAMAADAKKGKAAAAGAGAAEKGECHGVNECKGKGECGGEGHACGGKNTCKGKGLLHKTKAECDTLKGTFKVSSGDHHGHSH